MDSAINTGRKFPGYTTDELKARVAGFPCNLVPAETIEMMKEEIRRREAGLSLTLHQILNRNSTRKTA